MALTPKQKPMDDQAAILRPNANDRVAQGLLALTSIVDQAVPGAGSFFGALVGEVIPGQRLERLAEYATRLARRLRLNEDRVDDLHSRFEQVARNLDEQQRALFEDGAVAATRATSTERIEHIARVVSEGINGNSATASERRRFLNLLNELSDEDVVVLVSKTWSKGRDPDFRKRHQALLEPIGAHMSSPRSEHDREVLRKHRTARLVRLGVLEEKQKARGGIDIGISPLGNYVLRRLEILGDGDL